jgi:hypothetical protein
MVEQRRRRRVHVEALPAPACAFDVRIVEDKLGGQLGAYKVHLGADQRQLGLGVDPEVGAVLNRSKCSSNFVMTTGASNFSCMN